MMTVARLKAHCKKSWFQYVVALIFVVAIGARSTQLNAPPIDAHPMRQTDTACVIHFFANGSLNILEPRTCLIRPTTNTEGYFFLEFPAYEWIIALFQRIIGSQSWWTYRIVNIALFTVAFWSLYYGCLRYFNKRVALFSVLIFSWLPAGMFFFGQAIHPDVFMIATLFLSWNLLTLYIKSGKIWQIAAYLVLMSLSIVTRPFVALSLLPFSLVLAQNRRWIAALITLGGPLLPYLGWSQWQKSFTDANHDWQEWVLTGQDQLFKPATLHNLIWKNVVGEVLGKVVTALAGLGVISMIFAKDKLKFLFLFIFIAMIPVYWYIVPAGNVAHQYYAHVFVFPIIILAAQALAWLVDKVKNKMIMIPILGILIALVLFNGYRTSRYFYIPRVFNEETQMAVQIQNTVEPGKRVIFLGQSSIPFSIAFIQGWNIARPPADLDRNAASVRSVIDKADYLIVPSFDGTFPPEEVADLVKDLELASQTEWGSIYTLP